MVAGALEGYECCDRAGNGQRKRVGALGWTLVSDSVCDVKRSVVHSGKSLSRADAAPWREEVGGGDHENQLR